MNELLRRALMLPVQGSTAAIRVDLLHYFVIVVTMLAAAAIGGLTIAFFIRYRARTPRARTPLVKPPFWLKVGIISLPLTFFLVRFGLGYAVYLDLYRAPRGALEVYVTGKQWMWKFAYPDGPSAVGVLHVPARRPVRLLLTSRDVIHSFFVPAFRTKRDAIPGRTTDLWFEARKPGARGRASLDARTRPASRWRRQRSRAWRFRAAKPQHASAAFAATPSTARRTLARPGSISTGARSGCNPARPCWPTRPISPSR